MEVQDIIDRVEFTEEQYNAMLDRLGRAGMRSFNEFIDANIKIGEEYGCNEDEVAEMANEAFQAL